MEIIKDVALIITSFFAGGYLENEYRLVSRAEDWFAKFLGIYSRD